MPFFVYVAILLTAVFSVVLEWDALVVPSGAIRQEMQAVSKFGKPQPGEAPAAAQAAAPPAKPQATADDRAHGKQAVPDAGAQAASAAAQVQKAATPLLCDIAACAAAYRSFNETDCTYQPNYGPRRLCTKGSPRVATPAAQANAEAGASSTRCHVQACAAAYVSFNPQDCTYQPLEGPRRLCGK
jgi:hypothetical protein